MMRLFGYFDRHGSNNRGIGTLNHIEKFFKLFGNQQLYHKVCLTFDAFGSADYPLMRNFYMVQYPPQRTN